MALPELVCFDFFVIAADERQILLRAHLKVQRVFAHRIYHIHSMALARLLIRMPNTARRANNRGSSAHQSYYLAAWGHARPLICIFIRALQQLNSSRETCLLALFSDLLAWNFNNFAAECAHF
jgi:hypothetical protein